MNNNLLKIIYELQNPEHEKTYGTNEIITELRNKKREIEQQKPANKRTDKDVALTIKQFYKLDIIMKSIINLCIGLEKAKQFDGPPIGFSADEIFYTNETEHIFSFLDKIKIDTLKNLRDKIDLRINLDDYKFEFQLSKYNNQWLIDEIK